MMSLFSKQYKYFRLPGPVTSVVSLRARSSSTGRLIISFLVLYLFSALCFWHFSSYRDPTSVFFSRTRGYEPAYSEVRRQQADAYIEAATHSYADFAHAEKPTMCVGVVSIARENVRYFRTAVGSLLEGLRPEERKRIHLILFTAHTDPTSHPAHDELWFKNLPDQNLVYSLPKEQLHHLKILENQRNLFREKGLFDHKYLMKACLRTGTPYMALIEDDVVAMDGWFHRTEEAIKEVERQNVAMGKFKSNFLFLRLFYTEEYLGWNSEEWPQYLSWSVVAFFVTNISLLITRRCIPSTRNVLSTRNILAICFIFLPLSILLLFAAGRITIFPKPEGVHEMNKYGCCFQGVVFPKGKAEQLVKYYDERRVGFKDSTTEEYANMHGESRWALTPGVLQHIGRHSSKGDDFAESTRQEMAVSETLWSFPFELYDAAKLKEEHERVAASRETSAS